MSKSTSFTHCDQITNYPFLLCAINFSHLFSLPQFLDSLVLSHLSLHMYFQPHHSHEKARCFQNLIMEYRSDVVCLPILASCTIMHHHAPSCTIMHHHAPSCTVVHRRAPSCTVVHHRAPSCTIVHHRAPSCTIVHHHAPSCTSMHHHAPSCTIMHHHAPSCTIMHHHAPSCTIMHHHAPSCTIMHHHAPSCTIMHHHAPSCTIMHHHAPSCTAGASTSRPWESDISDCKSCYHQPPRACTTNKDHTSARQPLRCLRL